MLQPSWALLFIYYSFIIPQVTFGFVAQKKVLKPVLSETSKRQTSDDISYDSLSLIPNQGERGDPHGRLGSWIRANARHHIPIKYPRTRLDVHVSAGLYQIVDLDQRNNLATVSAYFDVWWYDEFLQWNTTQYSGIGRIFVPLKWIWKPEFYMYHSVIGRVPDFPNDASAELRFDGRVRMFVSIASKSFCPINFRRFPFDSQTCSFSCGSWTYQSDIINLLVEKEEIDLGDFYDNQEWLLLDARLYNGTTRHIPLSNESFSMVYMELALKRQSFYYVFNLVFPTTLVSLVAVIGFHAPINATGRRESKFRLGIMTLLSMSVMLLMLVGEMKFAMESVPGQRGSFSDVPLLGYSLHFIFLPCTPRKSASAVKICMKRGFYVHATAQIIKSLIYSDDERSFPLLSAKFPTFKIFISGIYYMTLIFIISISTCTSSIFVHLEKYALRNPTITAVPSYLRWLAAKKLFCCYVPKGFGYGKEEIVRNNNIQVSSIHSSPDLGANKKLIPKEVNFTEINKDAPLHGEVLLEGHPGSNNKYDIVINLLREIVSLKEATTHQNQLRPYWERILKRLETISLTFYLTLIGINITLFLYPELWY